MAATDKSQCSPCCKTQGTCEGCIKCLPLYLCVHGEITPYSTGTEADCCPEFDNRIPSSGCAWEGDVGCPTLRIRVRVEVMKLDGNCFTRVSSDNLAEYEDFDGTLPDGMGLTGIDEDGNFFDLTIERADTVYNPLFINPCRVCKVASCLPQKLCAGLSVNANSTMPGFTCGTSAGSSTGAWDCINSWDFPTITSIDGDEYTVTLSTADPEENQCVLHGHISGGDIDQDFDINLETFIDGPVCDPEPCVRGYSSIENDGDPIYWGNEEFEQWETTTIIDEYITLYTAYGDIAGYLTIKDLACDGECKSPAYEVCNGACPDLIFTQSWCVQKTLNAEIIAPGCQIDGFSWTMTPGLSADSQAPDSCSQFTSNDPSKVPPDPDPSIVCDTGGETTIITNLYYLEQACETDAVLIQNYRLEVAACGQCYALAGLDCVREHLPVVGDASCNPLLLDFEFPISWFRVTPGEYSCDCCSDGSSETGIIRITM